MFFWFLIAFIFGIAFRSWISISFFYIYLGFIAACGAFFVVRKNHRAGFMVVCFAAFALGAMRFEAYQFFGFQSIGAYNGESIAIQGRILREPDIRGTSVRYTVGELDVAARAGKTSRVPGKILVTNRLYPEFHYGDRVWLQCRLSRPLPFNGFRYDAYLAKDGIYFLCLYPNVMAKIESKPFGGWAMVKGYFISVKRSVVARLDAALPSPASGLAAGILLGDTSGIPEELMRAFRATGAIHIVAVSGYNVSIIVAAFMLMAPYFSISRRVAWFIVVPAIMGFVAMTGAESSVVRAGIMALIAGAAAVSERMNDARRAIVITAAIMLGLNPYLLRFDVGFQLSFLATLGLMYITPQIDSRVSRMLARAALPTLGRRIFAVVRESFATTVGASVAVAPVIFLQFGTFFLSSPLVNMLILWAVPWVMAYSFVAAVVAYVVPPVGSIIGWFAWVLLEYIINIVQWFS